MTDSTPSSADSSPVAPLAVSSALAVRFAHLVSKTAAEPTAVAEHRTELRGFMKALKGHSVDLSSLEDGVLVANGESCDATDPAHGHASVLLAARLTAYGVESVALSARSAEADLNDLVRLLATAPSQLDPAAFFAARASAIDARGIPRRLRARVSDAIPLAPPPAEPPPAPSMPDESEARADRLPEALEIPQSKDPSLARLLTRVQAAAEIEVQRPLLAELAEYADLAYRTGRHAAMLEAITALVAIEFAELERDPSDARRSEFAQPLRQLANPLILRQLAVMRHREAGDETASRRLQWVLYRFGTDGVEALLDEYANVPTTEGRATLLEALRALRRTLDVLHEWVRDSDEFVVREAVAVLGALGGESALPLLAEALRHDEPSVRRATVAALTGLEAPGAVDLLTLALDDASAAVRARAVAAWAPRGAAAPPRLVPLLDREVDTEVLYAAMHALGAIGQPEGVQALIACAQGESGHALKRNAAFRLQACAALVIVRTPQAMAAVGMLREDRDRVVRAGALRLVEQAVRRPTTGVMRVVTQ